MRSKGRAQSVFHLMVRQRVLAHLSWWPTISDVFDFASRPDGARLRNLRVIIGFELSTGSHPIFSFEGVLGIVLIVGSKPSLDTDPSHPTLHVCFTCPLSAWHPTIVLGLA
jgi:hypothetical protein